MIEIDIDSIEDQIRQAVENQDEDALYYTTAVLSALHHAALAASKMVSHSLCDEPDEATHFKEIFEVNCLRARTFEEGL